jgi:hypothetical protein
MTHYPTIAVDVEDSYRRERAAEQFRRAGGRSHRPIRGVADRLRWHRRHDRVTD